MMFRAVSEGIKEWLTARYHGEEVSPHSQKIEMTARLRNHLREQGDDPDVNDVSALVDKGAKRLTALAKAPLLSQLGSESVDEWMPLNRLEAHWVGNCRVYTVPDLIARIGDDWHLVRLTSQMSNRVPTEQQQVELGLMLDWAMAEPSLPNSPERFMLHRIGWLGNRWSGWKSRGNPVWLDVSNVMLAHDLKELRFAHANDPNRIALNQIAPTTNRRACTNCGFRQNCER